MRAAAVAFAGCGRSGRWPARCWAPALQLQQPALWGAAHYALMVAARRCWACCCWHAGTVAGSRAAPDGGCGSPRCSPARWPVPVGAGWRAAAYAADALGARAGRQRRAGRRAWWRRCRSAARRDCAFASRSNPRAARGRSPGRRRAAACRVRIALGWYAADTGLWGRAQDSGSSAWRHAAGRCTPASAGT